MNKITKDQAEHLLCLLENAMRAVDTSFDDANDYLAIMVEHQAWEALGYVNLGEMFVARELDKYRLAAVARRQSALWIKAGSPELSTRKIAEIMGVSKSTVQRDLATVPFGTVAKGEIPTNESKPVNPTTKPRAKSKETEVIEGSATDTCTHCPTHCPE